ncbi:RagB/SusD family nutrient uptake outer membrane protein [Pedobacter frigiditerrae]|uniref:RagB/SusD family nutrient uptake outer membrane protein n=1 Tax=Pedobacter frigiditerrae TaxID=2530452 RepID=A0A4V2MHN7_9SPHI|nr:RagB/SusD family nutrient uptake outer membrane protein [Pedobacter frigiditerrae]TCC87266.1 RagB/SusD family nutrient uptake outer membrane protein [Pedobacter frigiditerrae]
MKKIFYLIILAMITSSCKKFLDVQPESQIDKNQLFNSQDGFKEALNGVYTLCSSGSLYGDHLTFGDLEVKAQNFDFIDFSYQNIANFRYSDLSYISRNDRTWTAAYQAIVNCNYILSVIDSKKDLFTGNNYEIIKGETLALRAYLHFDLLRIYGPSYSRANSKAIPYLTEVKVQSTPFSTVKEVMQKLVADLIAAKALLKKADPIVSSAYVVGYPSTIGATETNNSDLFLQNRRLRMNYYTTCGELARVYLYMNESALSLSNALEVIGSNKFPFTKEADFVATDITKKDRIFYPELVSAWAIPGQAKRLESLFGGSNPTFSATTSRIDDIFEKNDVGGYDWRLAQWFMKGTLTTGGAERSFLQKYITNTKPIANLHPLVAPAIRLSEMYYIAAEAGYDVNPTAALETFNTFRHKRGIPNNVVVTDKTSLIELLVSDARKEFYGESQFFFMLKRLNHSIRVSPTQVVAGKDAIFISPIPDDELAYRNN